ncbi:MAG: 5'/3'-nucleotidase SurE [Acidobacteriota bacterium]
MPKILVTNDDGIESEGIKALALSLSRLGEVIVVAPSTDMTAASHSLTLNRPIHIEARANNHYVVYGTPTDCVVLGVNLIMKDSPPDLVVSGINKGGNLGDDVHYSGTVAGAVEATIYDIPAVAMSLVTREQFDFTYAAEFAYLIASKALVKGLPSGTLLNVNVPPGPVKGAVITKQGTKIAKTKLIETIDPRNRRFYWIGQDFIKRDQVIGTDYHAISQGFVSVTLLKNDMTDHTHLTKLVDWDSNWMSGDVEELSELVNEDAARTEP